MTMHRYQSHVAWQGSTAVGYAATTDASRRYPARAGRAAAQRRPRLPWRPCPAQPGAVAAGRASSCQLLPFLAPAAQVHVDVLKYDDDAKALMPANEQPMRITQVLLRPQISVGPGVDLEHVRHLVDLFRSSIDGSRSFG